MAELGEVVAVALVGEEIEECHFKPEGPDTTALDDEDVGNDDLEAAVEPQANDGGILGENLAVGGEAGWGKAGTWNRVFEPPLAAPNPRVDASVNPQLEVV